MAEMKTVRNNKSVIEFLEKVENEKRRKDGYSILEMMKEASGLQPEMWGDSIIGFGTQHYKYATGREGDWPLIGFSPRKQNLSLYITTIIERYEDLLSGLGKYKTGVGCLYINKLEDVNLDVLRELIAKSLEDARMQ